MGRVAARSVEEPAMGGEGGVAVQCPVSPVSHESP